MCSFLNEMSVCAWGEHSGWKEQETVCRRTGTALANEEHLGRGVCLSHCFLFSSEVLYLTCVVVMMPG